MQNKVKKTANYILVTDLPKQKFYISILGEWRGEALAQQYLNDLRELAASFDGPFLVVADFSQMKPFTYDLYDNVHLKAIKLLRTAGLRRSAEVMPDDSRAHQQLIELSQIAKAPLNLFGDLSVAEAFLDTFYDAPSFSY